MKNWRGLRWKNQYSRHQNAMQTARLFSHPARRLLWHSFVLVLRGGSCSVTARIRLSFAREGADTDTRHRIMKRQSICRLRDINEIEIG